MQQIQAHLENIDMLSVLIVLVLGSAVVFVTPGKHRLGLALAFLGAWVSLNRFGALPFLQSLTKVTFAGPFLLVSAAALLHPGERRKLPLLGYLYPIMAIVGVIFVISAEQSQLAMVRQIGFCIVSVTALLTVRTVVDEDSLRYVLKWITLGTSISIGFMLVELIFNPSRAYEGGLRRFAPLGANPNQAAIVMLQTGVLCAYLTIACKSSLSKVFFWSLLIVSFILLLLTGSRTALVAGLIILVPFIVRLVKNPFWAALTVAVSIGAMSWVLGATDSANIDRITDKSLSGRENIYASYIEEIKTRPMIGIFGDSTQNALRSKKIEHHPHNVILLLLYTGGFVYTAPWLLLIFASSFSALKVFGKRKMMAIQPMSITFLCFFLLGIYVHSMAVPLMYQPTDAWAFLHVFIAVLLMSLANDKITRREPAYLTTQE